MAKQCKECGEEDDFYRERDLICRKCTIEYQKNWRKKQQKQPANSEDTSTVMKIIDRLLTERPSITNEIVLQKLEEISEANAVILWKFEEMSVNEKEDTVNLNEFPPEKLKLFKK